MERLKKSLLRLGVLALMLVLVLVPAEASDWNGALNALVSGMKQEASVIDISAYGVTVDELRERYSECRDKGYYPWYVESYCQYYHSGDQVTRVMPSYLDRAAYNRGLYEQQVQKALKTAVLEGMSQWQIALSIHDYLVANCEYDQRYYTVPDSANYTAYDALVNGLAVCEGYALAYMDLLNRVGIPCVRVMSEEMDHTWNLIQINGKWYHVDCTWDDPSFNGSDVAGFISHQFFLLSDATISNAEHDHKGWPPYYTCTDTGFDTGTFWEDYTSAVAYMDSTVSFQRRGDNKTITITRRDSYTAEETILYTGQNPGLNIGSGARLYWTFGVSYYDGYVYFADPSNVYAVSPSGGDIRVVYSYDAAANGRYIFGCCVRDGWIYVTTNNGGNSYQTFRVALPAPAHTHSYTRTKVSSTCCEQGHTAFACGCGSTFASGYLDLVDHEGAGSYRIAAEPGFGVTGIKLQNCRWCGEELTIYLTDLNNAVGLFTDVGTGAYYHEPVLWAAIRGVTNGTSDRTFSPDDTCLRAQVVTFLWRSMGEPEPESLYNPFRDVSSSDYFYKAVLWAVEQGITTGMEANRFGPYESCTRAQVVTFLHRTAGTPAASSAYVPFTDVRAHYYYNAMLWAVGEGITTGTTTTTFEPDASCTRGQIVTFLHRYLAG